MLCVINSLGALLLTLVSENAEPAIGEKDILRAERCNIGW